MPVSAGAPSLSSLRRLCFEAEFGERLFQQRMPAYFTRALFACVFSCSSDCLRAVPGIVRGIALRFINASERRSYTQYNVDASICGSSAFFLNRIISGQFWGRSTPRFARSNERSLRA